MSAILGIFAARDQAPPDNALVRRLLGAMRARGGGASPQVGVLQESAMALGAARYDWEFASGFSGPVLVVQDGDVTVSADAALYYRDDLRRRLAAAGVRPAGQTSSHLILAAYRAWGARCAEYLEGDFAFVLWDRRAQRVVAARDFVGSRPLHWAALPGGGLVIASTLGGVVAHPSFEARLDSVELALEAAALGFTMTDRTVYAQARRVNPGETLIREGAGAPSISRNWSLPAQAPARTSSFEAGAEELRELLSRAVHERLAQGAPTAMWLSGGCDSTAVFAAGEVALARAGGGQPILPVSLRLPADDPGCETHFIEAVAGRWDRPIHWVESTAVPMVADSLGAAYERDEPWAPDYHQLSQAWCAATQAVGARVALNGHGGDLLFMSTPVILADHLRRLELTSLYREWQSVLGGRPRELFQWAVQPLLPPSALRVIAAARGGRRPHGYFERDFPQWFRRDFRSAHELDARVATGSPRAPGGSRSGYELEWLALHPHLGRLTSDHQTNALLRGADSRSPLMDARVMAFAASRPARDRRKLREGKRILRQSMVGLLPPEVLAPRPSKTGTLKDYARRSFDGVIPELRALAVREMVLAEMGIVNPAVFGRAIEWVADGKGDLFMQSGLLATLHAELWLRARAEGSIAPQAPNTELVSV